CYCVSPVEYGINSRLAEGCRRVIIAARCLPFSLNEQYQGCSVTPEVPTVPGSVQAEASLAIEFGAVRNEPVSRDDFAIEKDQFARRMSGDGLGDTARADGE